MSEFDIFFDEYEKKHNCSPEKYKCFEAGAQSKQAEIDELRKLIDEALDELQYPTATWEETVFRVIKILKGNTNED